ncbi:MAG TPA: hypothetical protein VKA34_13470 [Balneolales bacterium]|nr:hypothetical protein [Balneolales bacterium]
MTPLSDVFKQEHHPPILVISTGGRNLQSKIFIPRRCFNPDYSPRNLVVSRKLSGLKMCLKRTLVR